MAKDIIQRSFSGGEWSPLLYGRSDLEKFFSACRIMKNMIATRYGPAVRRPGLYYVAEVKDSSKKARLLPFKYSTIQAYILEAGDEYMRFFKDRGQILGGVGTEDISDLDNQIAHWLMNEIQGTDVDDNVGVVPHDGTASAEISILRAAGKVGDNCFDLDGQYDIEVGDHGDFSFTDNSDDTAFSIACWGFVTQQSGLQTLISKWRDSNATREWRLSLNAERKLQLDLCDTQADLSANRVGHWYLNDDAASTAVDDVSTNHDGVASSNTEDITATGKVNACFDFAGTETVYVTDHANLSFDDTADKNFSISAWVYYTPSAGIQHIFTKWKDPTDGEYSLQINADGKLQLALLDQSKLLYVAKTTDAALSEGWNFVTAVYDNADTDWTAATAANFITLYVNGSVPDQTATNNAAYAGMEAGATNVVIGGYYLAAAVTNSFKDKIDNVALFNKALSASEVSTLYNAGAGTESIAGFTVNSVTDDAISLGWHFFVVTYSAPADAATAADGIIFYVDGAAVDSTGTNDATYAAMQGGAEEIRIGSQRNAGDTANENFWGDKIDEMSVFGDVLTAAEVASLYSTTPYEIASPYQEDDLFGIQRIQSADVMFGFHSGYNPRKLKRLEHALWELEDIAFDWPPFRDENKEDTTITPSATVGTIELTATDPIFTADHVGSYFLIKHNRTDNKIEKDFGSAVGYSGILVDVEGSFRLRTSGVWTGVIELQRAYDEQLVLVLDAAPAGGAWSAGDIITGGTSGETCIIVSATDTTHYVIKQLSGSFTDNEVLTNQSGNARDVAATYPRYEGWHTLETLQSTDDQNFNVPGEESLGNAYLRVECTTADDAAINIVLSCERYYHYGIVKITGFTDATHVTGTVIRRIGSTDATKLWSEGAWSDERGYPSCGAFHEERLWVGGTIYEPHNLKGSMTSDWENFRTGDLDDHSLAYSIAANEMNAIQWLMSKDVLLLGTAGAEWKLGAFDRDEPLTPDNPLKPRIQTTYGSRAMQAIMLANVILFVQQEGRVVRGAQYVFEKGESGGYDAPDYTLFANHITESGIVGMTYQQKPEPILWAWLDNGRAIGMTFEPGEKIWGWFPLVTDGEIESMEVIPGVSEDEVWCIVRRTKGDGTVIRCIEYMKPRDWGADQKDCFFVDSGLTFDGGDSVTITGITKANPAVVTVDTYPTDGDGNNLADGDQVRIRYVGGMTEVNSQIFTISNPDVTAKTFKLRDKLDAVDISSLEFTAFAATISGDTTYDSEDVTNVSAADIAKLAVGAPITGTGIPDDTTVTAKDDDRFTMSAKATVAGTAVTITIGGTVEKVAKAFSGLGHLEGKTCSVLGDGSVQGKVVITSASTTIDDYANKVHIGLPYNSDLFPMQLDLPIQGGTIKAKVKRTHKAVFSFHNSLGCTFGSVKEDGTLGKLDSIPFRKTTDIMGRAVPLFTGEKTVTFEGRYGLEGNLFIRQSEPLPLTIRSIIHRMKLYG